MTITATIRAADAAARNSLRLLGEPPANWVPPAVGVDYDVLVIGGGQNGIAVGHALRRAGIGNFAIVDAESADRSGGWRRIARMNVLRTPKALPGPELGIPDLGFRAWFEACFGAAEYQRMVHIPRVTWADYLDWFRQTAAIDVGFGTKVRSIRTEGSRLRVNLAGPSGETSAIVRKIVVATGIRGFGGPVLPKEIAGLLRRALYQHTAEEIDFETFAGQRIAVIGAGASAFDAAAMSLESGADEVHLFSRRPELVNIGVARTRMYPGAANNFHRLPDSLRWALVRRHRLYGSGPPPAALQRVAGASNFFIHLGVESISAEEGARGVSLKAGGRSFHFDRVIFGTGYSNDPFAREEFAGIAPHIAFWRDRFEPEAGQEDEILGAYPYLGPDYQLESRDQAHAEALSNIHLYTPAAALSFGRPVGDVPSMGFGVPHLVRAIERDLYADDRETHLARAVADPTPDFEPSIYAHQVWAS